MPIVPAADIARRCFASSYFRLLLICDTWFNYSFAVLNDFEAVGYGVSVVPEEDTLVLNDAAIVSGVRQGIDWKSSAASKVCLLLQTARTHQSYRPIACVYSTARSAQAPKAVLGPGTGLGEAIMVYERSFGGYRCSCAERCCQANSKFAQPLGRCDATHCLGAAAF